MKGKFKGATFRISQFIVRIKAKLMFFKEQHDNIVLGSCCETTTGKVINKKYFSWLVLNKVFFNVY